MEKYFHELTYAEHFDIYNRSLPWNKVKKKYPEPPWCSNEYAVQGLLGCQDLMIGAVRAEEDCVNCHFYKRSKL